MGPMTFEADERVSDVHFEDERLIVDLMDGRTIIVPFNWYPRLAKASRAQLANWKLCSDGFGIHWPEIAEDIHTDGLLRGAPAPQSAPDSEPNK